MTQQEYIYAKEIEQLKSKLMKYERIKIQRGDIVYLKANMKEYTRGEHCYNGIRPWLVVSNNKGNETSPNCIIVPLTSKDKRPDLPTHVSCSYHRSSVCVEGIREIPQDKIEAKRYSLDNAEMQKVNQALMIMLGIEEVNHDRTQVRYMQEKEKKTKYNYFI